MLKRYLEKLISFGCSLQDVPRVDVSYEMPEGQNYHLVKYIPGKQGCLYVDIDSFKKEDQQSLFALFTELDVIIRIIQIWNSLMNLNM